MKVTVHFIKGSKVGQVQDFEEERISIGRNPHNTMAFDPLIDIDVSGDHAQFLVGPDGRLTLTDLGSTNGTFLNGQKIGGTVPLPPDSIVQFGRGGPEVRVDYTPEATTGRTRMMLAQVQEDLGAEREKAARQRKRRIVGWSVVLVLGLIGGGAFYVVSSQSNAANAANTAFTAAEQARSGALTEKADQYSKAKFDEAEALYVEAQELLGVGEDYGAARDRFADAQVLFAEATTLSRDKKEEKERQRLARLRADQERRDREAEERLRKLQEDLRQASAAERAQLEREIERLRNRKSESEKARAVLTAVEPKLVLIRSELFVDAGNAKMIAVPNVKVTEGTGFLYKDGMIITAKHNVYPHKYNPELVAIAKRFKEDRNLTIQVNTEVFLLENGSYQAAGNTVSKTATVLGRTKDAWVTKTQTVTITYNEVATDVDVTPHVPFVGDVIVLKLEQKTAAGLKTVGSGSKLLPVIGIGAECAPGTPRGAKTQHFRGELSEVGELISFNGAISAHVAGGPLLDLNGNLLGLIVGTRGSETLCLPIDAVEQVLKGGGSTQ